MQDTAACFRAERTFRDLRSVNGDRVAKALRAFDEADSDVFKDFRKDIPELLYFEIQVYFALCNEKNRNQIKTFFESKTAKDVVGKHPRAASYLSLPFLEFPCTQEQFKNLKNSRHQLRRQIEVTMKPKERHKGMSVLQRYVETRDRLRRCAMESHRVCTSNFSTSHNTQEHHTHNKYLVLENRRGSFCFVLIVVFTEQPNKESRFDISKTSCATRSWTLFRCGNYTHNRERRLWEKHDAFWSEHVE